MSHEGMYAAVCYADKEWRILQFFQQCLSVAVRRDAAIPSDDSVTTDPARFRNRGFPYTCASLCHIERSQFLAFARLRKVFGGSRRVEHGRPAVFLQLFAENGATQIGISHRAVDVGKTRFKASAFIGCLNVLYHPANARTFLDVAGLTRSVFNNNGSRLERFHSPISATHRSYLRLQRGAIAP